MPVRTVFRCTDGYACDLAVTPDGWVLAAVGLPAVDEQFVRNMDHSQEWEHIRARLHPGRSYAEWGAAVAGTAATLQLIVQRDGRTRPLPPRRPSSSPASRWSVARTGLPLDRL